MRTSFAPRKQFSGLLWALAAALWAGEATATDIRTAWYDAVRDVLVVEVAYRGTNPRHEFSVQWGPCQAAGAPARVVGRLIDLQGDDEAQEDYVARDEVSLAGIPCRPALVTLRLGRVSHLQVYVPERSLLP